MLSIIVYGRNDSHGYNLHKRAAISLNCLAEMLGDVEDELIFVDYNTPDDLPTFPEAIADTLTARARARLRILRVRPQLHRRFQQRTHLAALEPVARNVAVRASNPANRWILSTNTDIVLVPRTVQRLAEAVGDLPAGFYHTARFEIPEGLWESFDRADPIGTIAAVRALGVSARLNEVVYGSDPILYDGPGDFQLALRTDLFAIDGFDERMILGWHVDSNLAKRLALKRGPVASMIDHVFCYHCDHTRQATSTHRRDRLENDPVFFVDQVTRPDLPGQREHWGCAGEAIEEVRLPEGGFGCFRRMLDAVVAPLDAPFSETRYTAASYDDYRYDARHVLPFLADLLSSYPRGLRLGWCGVRRDMFDLARQAWRHLGFSRPIVVEAASASRLVDGEPDPEQVQIASGSEWLDRVDLLVFEFGRAADGAPGPERGAHSSGLAPADQEALAIVGSGFLSAVMHERSRLASEAAAMPRRFVGINCIHNGSEPLFATHVAAAATPFSSRLRHGFVAAAAPELDPQTADRLLIGMRLGRAGPISRREFALARELFGPLLEGRPIEPPRRHRAAIYAAIGEAFIAVVGNPARFGQLPKQARCALARLEELRPSTGLGAELGPLLGPALEGAAAARPGARPLSRFAAYEDWDDPAWSAFGLPYATDPRAEDAFGRRAGKWEQVHLLYGLDRAGKLAPAARVLVVATMPDAGIAAISWRVAHVDLLPIGEGGRGDDRGNGPEVGRGFWCSGAPYRPAALEILAAGTDLRRLDQATYDAVLFPHGALFAAGFNGALRSLELARRLLRPDGVLAFKAEIVAGAGPHPDFFDLGLVGEDGLAAGLTAATGLVADGGFDPLLSRATIDRIRPRDGPPEGPSADEGYFLTRRDGHILIPSLWFLRRQEIAGPPQWQGLRRWLGERWLGEQIGRLHVGAAGRRDAEGRIETWPGQEGHVFYGPYLTLPDGRYRATLQIEASPGTRSEVAARVLVEVAAGQAVLASRRLDRSGIKSGVLSLEFGISPEQAARDAALEIRLYSPADFSATFSSVDLRELPAARQPPLGQLWPARGLLERRGRGEDPAGAAEP